MHYNSIIFLHYSTGADKKSSLASKYLFNYKFTEQYQTTIN